MIIKEQIESIASTVFRKGVGGTKLEYRQAFNEARQKSGMPPVSLASWYRAWGELVESRAIVRISGTSSWRWCPPDWRAKAIPNPRGGFFAPSYLDADWSAEEIEMNDQGRDG